MSTLNDRWCVELNNDYLFSYFAKLVKRIVMTAEQIIETQIDEPVDEEPLAGHERLIQTIENLKVHYMQDDNAWQERNPKRVPRGEADASRRALSKAMQHQYLDASGIKPDDKLEEVGDSLAEYLLKGSAMAEICKDWLQVDLYSDHVYTDPRATVIMQRVDKVLREREKAQELY